jgi:lipopolysaccharide biosynthesis protein/glycosyltransferase involved in cell wall biosynthesis
MKVSVIICTYNRVALLKDSILAMQKQKFPLARFEIIVIDNNSTDDTRAATESLAISSPVSIRYIFEGNQGLSFARNAGIRAAKGDIVAFVDDDIDAESGWLGAIVAAFEKSDVMCAGGPIRPIWPGEKPSWLSPDWEPYLTINEFESGQIGGDFTPWGANISFRKSVFSTVGFFPTNLGRVGVALLSNEEVVVCKKITAAGLRISFAPNAVIHHKISPERLTKQWFYHRTFWQGRSDAILDLDSQANLHVSMIQRIRQWVAAVAIGGQNDFSARCYRKIALGYIYQAVNHIARSNDLSLYRTLIRFLTEQQTLPQVSVAATTCAGELGMDELTGRGILVVDYEVPQFDKYAGSRTTFLYLKLLSELGLKVYFLPDDFERREPYTTALEEIGIEVLHGEWVRNNWRQWVSGHSDRLHYVLFNRPNITANYIDFIKDNTSSVILFQGHDLHYLRLSRSHDVNGELDTLIEAEKYKKIEFEIIDKSDIVLTYSQYERNLIANHFPNKPVHTVPLFFYDRFPDENIMFTSRTDIMFVGGCNHKPNLDAILWFTSEIFPMVLQKLPSLVLHIVGPCPSAEVLSLASDNIKIAGHISDEELEEYYRRIRMVVVPLRFGAGVKGKTVEAIYRGIPLISTSIGLEGIPGIESIIQPTDTDEAFANEIVKLYGDSLMLSVISSLYRAYAKANLHVQEAKNTLASILHSSQNMEISLPIETTQPAVSARLIAFYLPQFHPIPENDKWWGKGFTEWSNVTKSKPLFPGHHQPHLPGDLGFYDLRLSDAREAQAKLAKEHGIEAFCYWHYWFHGKRLIERPFNEVLHSGDPKFSFCLAWANETWSRRWLGEEKDILMPQTYSPEDDLNHVRWLLPVFADPRCVKINGRALFLIYRPLDLPDPKRTTDLIRSECVRAGLPEPYLIGINAHCWNLDCRTIGFDATLLFTPQLDNLDEFTNDELSETKRERNKRFNLDSNKLKIYDYEESLVSMLANRSKYNHPVVPSIFVGWDNTPRRGDNGIIILNSEPKIFGKHLEQLVEEVQGNPPDERLVFLNAWNEWAEGNHLEPDNLHGRAFLEEVKRVKSRAETPLERHFGTPMPSALSLAQPSQAKKLVKAIAFFLPQYHPTPENDEWWGKGFTEWTNVTKALPQFPGHYQPHLPSELGFYDLRLPEVRKAQADLAREHGIHGFCFYHYWFSGKLLLERPLHDMLKSKEPNFPFCLCWANEPWTRAWDGASGHVLAEQHYGENDNREHIRYLSQFFHDPRYIKVDGKPLFLIYRANHMPDPKEAVEVMRDEARKIGIGEIYMCRVESFPNEHTDPATLGFDASVEFQPDWPRISKKISNPIFGNHSVHDYEATVNHMIAKKRPPYKRFPCVTPTWDNSSRRKTHATIFVNSTARIYGKWLNHAIQKCEIENPDDRIVFINAWNEWGEGCHLEPDQVHGRAYLEATRDALNKSDNTFVQNPIKEIPDPLLTQEYPVSKPDHNLAERDKVIAKQVHILAERDAMLIQNERLLLEKDLILMEREQKISEKEKRIQDLLLSASWKVTSPLRWGYDRISNMKKNSNSK